MNIDQLITPPFQNINTNIKLRATALGLLAACGRLGSVVAQFVNGSLQTNVALLLAVTSGTMLLGAAAAAALPRNQSAAGIALD
jgi:hypothetical protein